MPIASSRACEWCIGSTWCHLSGFYGLEELTNLRYIHIIYNLNCPESQLPLPLIGGRKGFVAVRMQYLSLDCVVEWCGGLRAVAVSWFLLCLQACALCR